MDISGSDVDHYYPLDYVQSRKRFKESFTKIKEINPESQLITMKIPSKIDNDLTTDCIYIPPVQETQNLCIISSGVHGVEAFAGSAVIELFIKEIFPNLKLKNQGYLLIHAINPFGFKYLRRVTENNVDLNRNFFNETKPDLIENRGYLVLKKNLEPKFPVRSPSIQLLRSLFRLIYMLGTRKFGFQDLIEAIGGGQYFSEKGLFFGGKKPEPQYELLKKVIRRVAESFDQVVHIDIHTGLGKKAFLYLIPVDLDPSYGNRWSKLLEVISSKNHFLLTMSNSPGFYQVRGDFPQFVHDTVTMMGKRAIGFTAEFGTLGDGIIEKLKTINRLLLENQGAHYGYSNDKVKDEVKEDFFTLFCPRSSAWKEQVLVKSNSLFQIVLNQINNGG